LRQNIRYLALLSPFCLQPLLLFFVHLACPPWLTEHIFLTLKSVAKMNEIIEEEMEKRKG
jgi:hypothetical protein